jgi:hypothetical protein
MIITYGNQGAVTTLPYASDLADLGSVDREWRRLYLGAQADALLFGIAQDVGLGRGAANRLDLLSGDSLAPAVDNNANLGLAAQRFSNIFGAIITSGDYVFENGWKLVEAERLGLPEGIALVKPDGKVARVWR